MKLALIFNPFKYKNHEENLKIVQKYFGLFPPLSLAWVAAIAEQAGHQVIIIDARTLNLSKDETVKILKNFNPDIMGFMITTYMFPDTLKWIRHLKKNLPIPVVVGGYNLRVYPKETLSHPEIDFGIYEHAYYTLPRLLEELQSKRNHFDAVPGLVYKKNSDIIQTPHRQKIDFDKFPTPARHLLPNDLYAEFTTERKNFTVMVTSLGCPYSCNFCEAGCTDYNPRSAKKVVAEMEECYHKYGIRDIDIFDYQFTSIRQRVLTICKMLQEKNLDLIWACRSRIDTVDRELLTQMKLAGCSRIYFGIESGTQDILDIVQKKIKIEEIEKNIAICRELEIKSLGFFLIGAPGETKHSVKQTIAFAKKLNLDYAQFSKCLAKPLTPLWKDMVEKTKKDYWKDWILGEEQDRELDRSWTSLSNQEINKLTRWAYISFYFRPQLIWRQLIKLKSFDEFKRKFFAFLDMFFKQENFSRSDENFKAFNENAPTKLKNIINKRKS